MGKRICYIPIRSNEEILLNVVDDLYNQVDAFEIINSTGRNLTPCFESHDKDKKIFILDPLDPLCYEQSLNVAIKHSIIFQKQDDFIIWAHFDIRVKPGAVDALMQAYEQIKDTKWGVLYGYYDTLCLFNPKFFTQEGIWGDPNLFPNYFGDNHRYRIMDLRGYSRSNAPDVSDKVEHIGSQTIRNNAYFGIVNALTFSLEAQLYARLWGGGPGQETIIDPTAQGLYPIRNN